MIVVFTMMHVLHAAAVVHGGGNFLGATRLVFQGHRKRVVQFQRLFQTHQHHVKATWLQCHAFASRHVYFGHLAHAHHTFVIDVVVNFGFFRHR